MRSVVLALAAVLVSSGASAAPVMLNCTISTQNDGPLQIEVQLNEGGGTVSYSFPHSGRSVVKPAIFAPDRVSFGSFSVNRTDLTIQRINDGQFDQSVFKLPPVEFGRCTLDERERAF